MNAAVEGIFEKDIVRRKREVEVSTKKLPTLSAKLVPQDGGGISTRNLARMIRFAEVSFFFVYGGGVRGLVKQGTVRKKNYVMFVIP